MEKKMFNFDPSISSPDNLLLDKDSILVDEYYDKRTGITCSCIRPDFELYHRYVQLLMNYRNEWNTASFLDYGLIPLIMAPSFMQNFYADLYSKRIAASGINIIKLPAISFFTGKEIYDIEDYWVSREESSRFTCIPADKVRTIDVLKLLEV